MTVAGENSPLLANGKESNSNKDASATSYSPSNHYDHDLKSSMIGRVLLFVVAFLYGTLNVTLRFVYELDDPPSASALSTTRGWLAVLCFVPLIINKNANNLKKEERQQQQQQKRSLAKHEDDEENSNSNSNSNSNVVTQQQQISQQHQAEEVSPCKKIWWVAMELAFWNFGAQGLLTFGLLSTESARASFLTQTSVVMTPVISAICGYKVSKTVWIGCVVALFGLLLMSGDDSGGIGDDISVGDIIVLLGALCWSLYIFRLSSVGDSYNEIQLQANKTLVLAWLYSGWFLVASYKSDVSLWPGWRELPAWCLIFYSALGPGALADVIQQGGQKVISASEANIVLSMEPVFTALLGRLILGEATSWQEKCGGGLIILAALIATR